MKNIIFFVILTLLISLLENSFFASIAPILKYVALNFSLAASMMLVGRYEDALIICLFGGIFENLFGLHIIGMQPTFYSFVILLLIFIKRHLFDNFFILLAVYLFSLYIYFTLFFSVSWFNIPLILPGLLLNICITLFFVKIIKRHD